MLEPSKPIASVLQKDLLTHSQQSALDTLIVFTKGKEQFFRLQGYAGTGKSFLGVGNFKYDVQSVSVRSF